MNFNIKDLIIKKLNIRIRGNDKKDIIKIFLILILINIIMTIIIAIFPSIQILKTILLYIISVIYIGITIYIIKKENDIQLENPKEPFENKYDPILTKFLIKNEFILDNDLLNAEIYYLMKKGYVEFDKEKNVLKIKNRNQFKQIDSLEKINTEKIKEYSTEEIPSYESMFINKILFAFHDEVDLDELKRNEAQSYYFKRGEMCKLPMEKMLLYEIEKKNMLETSNKLNFVSIAGILNIITDIIIFMVMARFNLVLLLATIINIALNVIIIKNENILSYKYSEEVVKYIDNLLEHVNMLKKGNIDYSTYTNEDQNIDSQENELIDDLQDEEIYNKKDELIDKKDYDEELKFLFGINTIEDFKL